MCACLCLCVTVGGRVRRMQSGRGRDPEPEKPSAAPACNSPACGLNSTSQRGVCSRVPRPGTARPSPDKALGQECKCPFSSITLFSSVGIILRQVSQQRQQRVLACWLSLLFGTVRSSSWTALVSSSGPHSPPQLQHACQAPQSRQMQI